MTVQEIIQLTGAKALTNGTDLNREVRCGYACDLLSWVMAHGQQGMAWVTVQTHMNVIAVATLHDMSCVIVPEGGSVPAEVAAKAGEEGIAILSSPMTAYEISGKLYSAGVKSN